MPKISTFVLVIYWINVLSIKGSTDFEHKTNGGVTLWVLHLEKKTG